MSITANLTETAKKLKSMGVLGVRLTSEASRGLARPSNPACIKIDTGIDRPVDQGGGKFSFSGYINAHDHHDLLNAILRSVGDMVKYTGLYGAVLTNAIEDKQVAERKSEIERRKVARVLDGKSGSVAFGDVLIEVAADGAVWMLDPIKRGAGFGFRFDSLDDLWRTHPNLRPVSWTNDGIICRSFAMAQTETE